MQPDQLEPVLNAARFNCWFAIIKNAPLHSGMTTGHDTVVLWPRDDAAYMSNEIKVCRP